jgi:hypothetical protein
LASVRTKSSRAARARSTNRRTASEAIDASTPGADAFVASANGGTATTCSPERCSTSRLVARMVRPGLVVNRSGINGPASRRCSKLSRISSTRRSRRKSPNVSAAVRLPVSRTARTRAIVAAIRAGSRTAASGTNQTPSRKSAATSSATRTASRVLPTPPGPVSVTRRTPRRRSRSATAATSRTRPTKLVSGTGK